MKPAKQVRRAILTVLITGSTFGLTGCASKGFSVASLNPFSRNAPEGITSETGANPGITESIAASGKSAGATVKSVSTSVGSSAKSMFGKSTNAVASVFRRDSADSTDQVDKTDPLRLDNKPDKIDPEVFVANGQLWESTGDASKAMESYTKALEQDPKHSPALTSMARLQFRQGNLDQAVTYFQRAIAEKPQDAGLHNDLGLTLSKLGNQAAAVASLEKALQIAPGTSRYANNLASVRFEAGDANAAMTVLMQNNKPAVAHFNMAYLHYKAGQMPQAQTHLSEAMKFEPQAQGDTATGRAIQRSRDMLAQINSMHNTNSIAQTQARPTFGGAVTPPASPVAPSAQPAASGTTVAASSAPANITYPSMPSYSSPVQQTSQSVSTTPASTVAKAPASTTVPANTAISAITPPPATNSNLPIASATPSTTTPVPKWNTWNQAVGQQPAASDPAATTASLPAATESKVQPASTEEPASTGFTLPDNFQMPGTTY
ncbi:tetratricopeptide repeat protein [Rubripirellula amarantea]|nr:tetratricopeptide repeat protein [Rubripirellula amarantea]